VKNIKQARRPVPAPAKIPSAFSRADRYLLRWRPKRKRRGTFMPQLCKSCF